MKDDCPMTFAKAYEELSPFLNARSFSISLELWWYGGRTSDVPDIEYRIWADCKRGEPGKTLRVTAPRLEGAIAEMLALLNPSITVTQLSEAEVLISALHPGTTEVDLLGTPPVTVEVVKDEPVDVSLYNVVPTPDLGLVHILQSGLPLCRFSNAAPHKWPQGNVWVSGENGPLDDLGLVNCVLCKREHATLNP